MAFGNFLFKIKLKITDLKLKTGTLPSSVLTKIRSLRFSRIKSALYEAVAGFFPMILQTPADLKQWRLKSFAGLVRCSLLFSLLSIVFYISCSRYAFTANDGFISFRYVSNAVKGWGYTFNPPPFEPVSGYTSFLWLVVLRGLWAAGFQPPFGAHLATFVFSMGQIGFCFLFVRRMNIQSQMRAKSLLLFLAVCLILLTNGTFLAFMTSGTETALFNFLVLWWTYAATSEKNKSFSLVFCASFLALCRPEGLIFIPATVCFLILFAIRKRSVIKSLIALPFAGLAGFYYIWLNRTYGDYIPLSVSAYFRDFFPPFGRDYIVSFVIEYALYFWFFFFFIWSGFKFLIRRQKGFSETLLLILTFGAYLGYYLAVMGGDVLEYRPLSPFIPLCAVAGVKMLAENVVGRVSTVLIIVLIYILISTSIPMAHRAMTEDLETRRETAFLYRPVSGKAGWFAFFTKKWDEAQKRLIYQGVGLRHREHKVLSDLLLQSFPDRKDGSRIPKTANILFAWDFVGVPAWTLPEVNIIDLSGQNSKIVAGASFKYPDRRLFGHERDISNGFLQCFGGSSITVDPYSGKKNMRISTFVRLSDGMIKGCEKFWKTQQGTKTLRKEKSL